MLGYRYILKNGFLFCCMSVMLFASAQQHDFRFFPVKDLTLSSHGFINKIGSRFFLLNRLNKEGLGLYIYDTVTLTGADHSYEFPKQVRAIMHFEKSLTFVAVTPDSGGIACHFIELGERGEVLRRKTSPLPIPNLPFQVIISENQKHVLFYRYGQKGNDSTVVYGFMIGLNGEIEKQLSYDFKYDKERDIAPKFFLDNEGNTHILVFDHYNNYRLSTNLTINSVLFAEEEMISEEFMLGKTKLKTMHLFQNEQSNSIQAEGMYADGTEKIMKGFYRINFPAGRKNELSTKLFPVDKGMVNEFRKGLSITEKNARNSLQLQDILYSDSGSFAVMRLNVQSPYFMAFMGRASTSQPLLLSGARRWDAPRLIIVKLGKEERIEWHTIKALDIFRSSASAFLNDISPKIMPVNYNGVMLIGGEKQQATVMLYQADAKENADAVFVTFKDGKQIIEKIPPGKLALSNIQFLEPSRYGSLYTNLENGDAGILFIQKK